MTEQLYNLNELNSFLLAKEFSSCIVLADSNTHHHCLADLLASCEALNSAEIIEIDAGESSKDLEIASGIWEALLEFGTDRHACLLNLGGGMITDLGGFVASTFKRGIPYIHIPTSLLAMVDAAIGGKTGINLSGSKNQVGTFAHPVAIVTCTAFLRTLPERELRSGMAEMLKHGLIADLDHFTQLTQLHLLDVVKLEPLIRRSAEIKNAIVKADFRESGQRQVLNFGHTTGHALESAMAKRDTPLLHGEAVALGLICALHLSVKLLHLDAEFASSAAASISRLVPLPTGRMVSITPETLWPLMQTDKKNRDGQVQFVLLEAPGQPRYHQIVDYDSFAEAWLQSVD